MNRTSDLRVLILNLWSSTDKKLFIWHWWWLPLSLSKRQSLLPTTVLLWTTPTKKIKPHVQMLHLGSVLYRQQYCPIYLANNNSSIKKNCKKNNNKQTYRQGKEHIITWMISFTGCLLHCHISLCTFDDFARSSRHFTWCCWRDQVLPHSKFYSTGWWSGEKWWRNGPSQKNIFISYLWTKTFKRVSMG